MFRTHTPIFRSAVLLLWHFFPVYLILFLKCLGRIHIHIHKMRVSKWWCGGFLVYFILFLKCFGRNFSILFHWFLWYFFFYSISFYFLNEWNRIEEWNTRERRIPSSHLAQRRAALLFSLIYFMQILTFSSCFYIFVRHTPILRSALMHLCAIIGVTSTARCEGTHTHAHTHTHTHTYIHTHIRALRVRIKDAQKVRCKNDRRARTQSRREREREREREGEGERERGREREKDRESDLINSNDHSPACCIKYMCVFMCVYV